MRASRFTAGMALVALLLIGSTAPSPGFAPTPTQTVTKMVTVLCTTVFVSPVGGEIPDGPPITATVPVTFTAPRRVHTGNAFQVQLSVPVPNEGGAGAHLSGAPGITPSVQLLEVPPGSPLSGSLTFTATGRAGTLSNWRLNDFDFVGVPVSPPPGGIVFAVTTCVPTTPAILASTRIIGPGQPPTA